MKDGFLNLDHLDALISVLSWIKMLLNDGFCGVNYFPHSVYFLCGIVEEVVHAKMKKFSSSSSFLLRRNISCNSAFVNISKKQVLPQI